MDKDRKKKTVEGVLAENVARLIDKQKASGLWRGPGVSLKTANNVTKARHNTKLETITTLAKALGVDPYHLLMPADDQKFLAVLQAWAQSDESERDNLHVIAEAMLKRKTGEHAARADRPTVNSKRDRTG